MKRSFPERICRTPRSRCSRTPWHGIESMERRLMLTAGAVGFFFAPAAAFICQLADIRVCRAVTAGAI